MKFSYEERIESLQQQLSEAQQERNAAREIERCAIDDAKQLQSRVTQQAATISQCRGVLETIRDQALKAGMEDTPLWGIPDAALAGLILLLRSGEPK